MVLSRQLVLLAVALAVPCAAQSTRPDGTKRPAPTHKPEAPAPDVLATAEKLLEQQKYSEAEAQLLEIVKGQAGNPQAWFDLGFAQSRLGKNADAITAYRKAVELSPKWFEASLNLGVALASSGNLKEAATVLSTTVTLKPSTNDKQGLSRAWFSLAEVLEDTAPAEALKASRKAAEMSPEDIDIALLSAGLMVKTGDAAGGEPIYLKAAEAGSDRAAEGLITLYLKQKRLNDAETWLRKYLTKNPQSVPAQTQLGRVLEAQGKIKEALALLEAIPDDAADAASARELANLYMQDKQYEPAAKLYQTVVARTPRDPELRWNYGSALLHLHKYPEAQDELLKAVSLKPGLADAYYELAVAAQQNKNYEMAIRVLDARAKMLPENAGTYWLRAVSFDSLHAHKQAAENYRLFLSVDAGKSPDQEFQARHRLIALDPRR